MIDLWREGWGATGEGINPAELQGTYDVDTIDEAVAAWWEAYREKYPNANPDLLKREEDGHWSFWRIRFFDNETDARRFLG